MIGLFELIQGTGTEILPLLGRLEILIFLPINILYILIQLSEWWTTTGVILPCLAWVDWVELVIGLETAFGGADCRI